MLSIKNLSKTYKPKKGKPVVALKSVSIDFGDTGLVFLLGKSGSGKSTLLNIIGGLDSYTSGDITIKGKSSANFKQSDFDSYRNTFLGFIFQEFNILEDYSVSKNIGLALELQNKKADQDAINNLLEQVDLAGFGNRKPNELSGGQKQRVAIARALIKNPEIIMADEPTGALDSKTGKQVFDTLKKLAKTKLVIVVSHDRENAEVYGDRIVELADGEIISDRIRAEVSGELVEQKPVTVLSNDLIQIQPKHKLTKSEINEINDFLSKSNDDVFISSSSVKNEVFTKDLQNNKNHSTKFEKTSAENNPIKSYDPKDFKLVRSRLPFRDSFKMGVSGLKHKKVRLFFTILLSLVAFVMFGLSSVAAQFNSIATQVKTLQDQNTQTVTLSTMASYDHEPDSYISSYYGPSFTEKQLKFIKENTQSMSPVYKPSSGISFERNFAEQTTIINGWEYYPSNIKSFVEISDPADANLTDATTSKTSRLPQTFKEIAITDYIASSFFKNGHIDKKTITSYDDLLGLTIGYDNYTIVGVYSTDTDLSSFEKIKDQKPVDMDYLKLSGIQGTIAGMGIVKEGFASNKEISSSYINFSGCRIYLKTNELGTAREIRTAQKASQIYDYQKSSIVFVDGFDKNFVLKDNEIIISPEFYAGPDQENLNQDALVQIFQSCADKTVVIDGKTYNVVGVMKYNSGEIFISDNAHLEFAQKAVVPRSVVVKLSNNYEKNYNLINELNKTVDAEFYFVKIGMETIFSPLYGSIENMLFVLRNVFMWIALIFSIFAGLLLMNFISVSIAQKRKDIGVLRAIGARSLDVFKIFYYESLVVGAINFVLALATVFILSWVINSMVGIAFLIVGIVPILLLAGLIIFITALATFLPVYKFARKKPVDTINNR